MAWCGNDGGGLRSGVEIVEAFQAFEIQVQPTDRRGEAGGHVDVGSDGVPTADLVRCCAAKSRSRDLAGMSMSAS